MGCYAMLALKEGCVTSKTLAAMETTRRTTQHITGVPFPTVNPT